MDGVPDSSFAPVVVSDVRYVTVRREDIFGGVLGENFLDDLHFGGAVDDGEVGPLAHAGHECAAPVATHSVELVAVTRAGVKCILCKKPIECERQKYTL
jgi:hypothetical protein